MLIGLPTRQLTIMDIIGIQNMEKWKMGSDMGTLYGVDNHGLPTWKDNLLLCLGRVTES
jgi:hypothetical protein